MRIATWLVLSLGSIGWPFFAATAFAEDAKQGGVDAASASELALKGSGLGGLGDVSGVRLETIRGDRSPFLAGAINGQQIWVVTVENVSLRLKSQARNFKDPYKRKFDIYIDPDSGVVFQVVGTTSGGNILPEPRPEGAERQLRRAREEYLSFVNTPVIPFTWALGSVLGQGIGSPLVAKVIVGRAVMRKKGDGDPLPVWAISLSGIPPLPRTGLTRIRNIVDGRTGKWLCATSIPVPEQQSE